MGEWIYEEGDIKEFIRSGFSGVYLTSHVVVATVDPINSRWQSRLSEVEKDNISGGVTKEEIKAALWSLKPFKARGPNDLHAGFFQKFWVVVGGAL